jgi:NAD(P)-dependent dehydrogenase (short-subunit alcohol dehydrogenase family)
MDDAAAPSSVAGVVIGGGSALNAAVRAALAADGLRIGDDQALGCGALGVVVLIADPPGAGSLSDADVRRFDAEVGVPLGKAFSDLRRGVTAIRSHHVGGSVVLVAPPSDHRAFDALHQGLRLLARAAALELGPEGIRVNVVLPGSGDNPLGQPCTATDIAASVAFLASDRARFMTGADLVVDGGRLAQ